MEIYDWPVVITMATLAIGSIACFVRAALNLGIRIKRDPNRFLLNKDRSGLAIKENNDGTCTDLVHKSVKDIKREQKKEC